MTMARPPVTITPYRDGPLIVRGPVQLRGSDGIGIKRQGAPIALCRCGRSRRKPLCDGTHKLVGFRAPGAADGLVGHTAEGNFTGKIPTDNPAERTAADDPPGRAPADNPVEHTAADDPPGHTPTDNPAEHTPQNNPPDGTQAN